MLFAETEFPFSKTRPRGQMCNFKMWLDSGKTKSTIKALEERLGGLLFDLREKERKEEKTKMRKFDPWPVFFRREWNRTWPFLVGFAITGAVITKLSLGLTGIFFVLSLYMWTYIVEAICCDLIVFISDLSSQRRTRRILPSCRGIRSSTSPKI